MVVESALSRRSHRTAQNEGGSERTKCLIRGDGGRTRRAAGGYRYSEEGLSPDQLLTGIFNVNGWPSPPLPPWNFATARKVTALPEKRRGSGAAVLEKPFV